MKSGRRGEWKNELIRQFDNSTIGRMEKWNVKALVEIPLRREKNGKVEGWNPDSYQRFSNDNLFLCNSY
jgi:hypothetical protein